MALAMNKIILANATTNTAGAYFSNVSLTAANAGTVIPAGTYMLFPAANVVITGNNGSSITTLLANNTRAMILSAGVAGSACLKSTVLLLPSRKQLSSVATVPQL